MEEPQPAIRAPGSGGQASPTPPAAALPPAPPPAAGGNTPQIDLHALATEFRKFVDRVASMRQVRAFRASSALVRWLVLVAAVGLSAALLVALTISALVSLIPHTG